MVKTGLVIQTSLFRFLLPICQEREEGKTSGRWTEDGTASRVKKRVRVWHRLSRLSRLSLGRLLLFPLLTGVALRDVGDVCHVFGVHNRNP